MRFRKHFSALIISFIALLSGCDNLSSVGEEKIPFMKYDTKEFLAVMEYKIVNAQQLITVYFPVVTNKTITSTELGGVGAKLRISDGATKVKLKPDRQERLNEEYEDYYISFLKYQVKIENTEILKTSDCIELFDTRLWIYHETEFETIGFDDIYLRINIVADESKLSIPDWNMRINEIRDDIKRNLI